MPRGRQDFSVVPIRQVDVFDAVRTKLLDLMEHGGYARGDQLPSERVLAEKLGVSRVAVREAMKVLEAIGKVDIVHGSGTYVRDPVNDPVADALRPVDGYDAAFVRHLVEARSSIELKIAELAAERATASRLKVVSKALDRLVKEHLPDAEVGSLNVSFEAAMAEVAGNPVLSRLQSGVHRLWIEAWGSLHMAPGTKQALHAEHVEMFDALSRRDGETAVVLMRQHIDRFRTADWPRPDTDSVGRRSTDGAW